MFWGGVAVGCFGNRSREDMINKENSVQREEKESQTENQNVKKYLPVENDDCLLRGWRLKWLLFNR